ncbi:hypothetical protein [Pelomonas sp. KK5]|uniref:hypothetical protein n=1 Tax=Pelomonas sp. KK5 TaxID=1855730 RepID=UPI00097C2E09|nr:hypothetical protein [Pelomonas sp. KK5]
MRRVLPLTLLLLLCAAANAAEVKPASSAAKPVAKASTPTTGGADCAKDSPTTTPANSGMGAAQGQGASVKLPPKPHCPGDLAGKVAKP